MTYMTKEIPEGWRKESLSKIRQDPPDERCIYCGKKSEQMTEEHVPPDNLYRGVQITHEQITAPACLLCNNPKSPDDEWFRNIIVPYCAKGNDAAANLLAGKVKRGIERQPKIKKEEYDRVEDCEQMTPSGIYLKRRIQFTFSPKERACMLRMYDRLSKAMYWYFLGRNPAGRNNKLLEAWEAKTFYEALQIAPTYASGNPNIFQYRIVSIGEDHEFFLMWSCFFKKLAMISISGPSKPIRRQLEQKMRHQS